MMSEKFEWGTTCGNTTKERHHCAQGKSERLRVKSEEYKFREFEGITLISLVITIIILIILAGVAVNLSLGKNGIFTKAKEASEKYKISEILEKLELEKVDLITEKNGEIPTVKEYIDHLIEKKIIAITDVQDINENTKNIIVEGYSFIVEKEESKEIKITEIVKKELKSVKEGGTTHIAKQIQQYTWEELNQIAKMISDNSGTTVGKINNNTVEVIARINGKVGSLGVGDLITLNGKQVRILGFNHDTLKNQNAYVEGENNTYAGITFEFTECLTTAQLHDNSTNSGGWGICKLRNTLNTSTYDSLENKEYIKEVNKKYMKISSDSNSVSTVADKVWLLSCSEIWNNACKEPVGGVYGYSKAEEGEQYKYYEDLNPDCNEINSNLVKKNNGTPIEWWLRSSYFGDSNGFCIVNKSGNNNALWPTDIFGVSPSFSI